MKRVYFIKPIGMDGPIKIGCSVSPDGRRESLKLWVPFPLEILAEIEGDFALERRFHAAFEQSHIGREWFHPSDDLAAAITAINEGAFDTATLPAPVRVTHRKDGEPKRWTPEQRLNASYRHRCNHMREKSGYYYSYTSIQSPEGRAQADAYLAEPHIHGSPCIHGAKQRREWLAKVAPESAAA